MLIKKLQRILKNYRDKEKVEVIFRFLMYGRYFFAIRPKKGYIISSNSYIVSEFPDYKLKPYQREEILDVIRRDNKFRGRHYTFLC